MFKHTISELKEALVCLQAGQVTLPYPLKPAQVEATFRGLPALLPELCIACGACANACPARLITLTDIQDARVLQFELARCTYCGNCRDACPQDALEMTSQFETSLVQIADLVIHAEFKLLVCRECGETVTTERAARLVDRKLTEHGVGATYARIMDLCISCRRRLAMENPDVTFEVVP